MLNCPVCGGLPATLAPMRQHDSYWCKVCDTWISGSCRQIDCEFCADRPEKPSMVKDQRSWDGELP